VGHSDPKRHVLCIADEPETVELIRLILQRRNCTVQGAAAGEAGLRAARQSPPDLILLDLMTPDMDGWDVYQRLKAEDATSHVPIIIVTTRSQNIDQVIGRQIARVDDYIVKPFSPKRLLVSVDRVLRTGQPAG
jgi:two-component system response regulator VicR